MISKEQAKREYGLTGAQLDPLTAVYSNIEGKLPRKTSFKNKIYF